MLNISNSTSALRRIPNGTLKRINVFHTNGCTYTMNVINYEGFLSLINSAKKPNPEVVRWINDTVFPAVGLKTDETLPALVITDNAEKDETEELIVLTPDAISTAPAPTDLRSFNNSEFGELSIMMIEGKPYFPATECAKALGYSNPYKAIGDHCPHVTKREVGVQTGKKADGTPAMQTVSKSYIPEGDLYRLIAHSKLPSALKFEHWVFDEVLPSINKHGAYIMGQETMTETELIAKALIACNRIAEEAKAQLKQARVELRQKEEEVASLQTEKIALIGEVQTWDYRSIINALMRKYAAETNKLHSRINELSGASVINDENDPFSLCPYHRTKSRYSGDTVLVHKVRAVKQRIFDGIKNLLAS